MARLIHGVATPAPMARQADPLTDLNRLLYRLQQSILRADADREARLRADEFEREKVQTNIRYAQSLLTKLEQEALTIKIHARRQDLQTALVQKREALEQLVDRMDDLAEMAAATADSDHDTSEGEDLLAAIIATPSESMDSSRSPDVEARDDEEEETPAEPVVLPPPQQQPTPPGPEEEEFNEKTAPPTPPTSTTQTLRPRGGPLSEKETPDTAHTTGSRTALFGDHNNLTASTATATAEAILDHQRAEQDMLSESILKLAGDLKASSLAFTATLEEDREVVDRAGQGMSKTGEGMDAVTKRVGALQRMTEGEGWWGRMRLYAQVYGLMVVLVLVVFVLPKLRF
ncbi:hypothetical protein QBC39DRAFT_381657 [Podospora conica]|nr:hypothetical protein QBC39DRAFT_381657 [Schizothecium conicum]